MQPPPRASSYCEQRLLNGVTIFYQRCGGGPPLILMHPLGAQSKYFARIIAALSRRYTVYALDLPGHGRSSREPVGYDEPYLRRAIVQFIQLNGLTDVTLVGECTGGVLALTVATEVPQRILRMVAVNPYDYAEQIGRRTWRNQDGWPFFSGAEAVYRSAHSWVAARELYPSVPGHVDLAYGMLDWSLPHEREENRRVLQPQSYVTIDCAGHCASLDSPAAILGLVMGSDFVPPDDQIPYAESTLLAAGIVFPKRSNSTEH